MIETPLQEIWNALSGKAPHNRHFLREVRLAGIRGIDDLRVAFHYPVTVIAGGNTTGKSTVLFAAAGAYRVPGAGPREFAPSSLFPAYRPKVGGRTDPGGEIVIEYTYSTPDGNLEMRWRFAKGWNRSFFGRRGAKQPSRPVYLRTLANLANPSEVRSILRRSRPEESPPETALTASQVEFAQTMLPFRYSEVVDLSLDGRNLLYATQDGGAQYSELQMAAGERAVFRLAQAIAQLDDALVLIDEVEAGLHPWAQQLLMLQLQRLALRRGLQVLVTTHSPVVLDAVPRYARIFLERGADGAVSDVPPYQDVIQNALYGRSLSTLNFLCEDLAAEAVLDGVLDTVLPRHDIRREFVRIGRDTGADEFPTHAAAFRKFGALAGFVFVLDGDQRGGAVEQKIRAASRAEPSVLYLPGRAPEEWVWDALRGQVEGVAPELGVTPAELAENLDRIEKVYAQASDAPGEIAKSELRTLADTLRRRVPEVCRLAARIASRRPDSDIQPLVERVDEELAKWRARQAG